MKKFLRFSNFLKLLTFVCLAGLLFAYLTPFVHPNTFKLLPFFGLAYPIILFFTVLLLIIWIFLRSRMTILIALVLIIGGKLHFRMIAIGSDTAKELENRESLHVMSYNVRLFDLYNFSGKDRLNTRNSIFDFLRSESPDVVCFQEFYHQDKPTDFVTRDTITDLLQTKDYHERYAHKLRGRQNFGVAMLSRFPMIAKGDVMFEQQGDSDFNYCIYADIVKGNDTFRVYNVHLQSIRLQSEHYSVFEDIQEKKPEASMVRLMMDKLIMAYPKRADQARRVMQHVLTSPYPTIVCGDFNDTPLSYTYHQFNKSLIDAYRNTSFGIGTTYAGRVPAGRIDYIFHTKDLESSDFEIQENALSDHRAISCKVYQK